MKPNVIVALLVGLVLGFVGGRAASGSKATPGNTPTVAQGANKPAARQVDPTVFKVPIDGAPSKGSVNALVTVVEFSDYECPFCSRAHNTVVQLQKDYGSKLRVVMRQNPLSFHPHAKPAALAALAAGEQGKYWEMHDVLFANQKKLDGESLEGYAKQIGLDVAKWKEDMTAQRLSDTINQEQALAQQLGANGTPAFFINGRFLSGAQPIENFKALIDEELAKAEGLVKTGVAPSQVYARTVEKGLERAPTRAAQAPEPAAAAKKVEIPADSPVFGPATAKVTIVEWSDFECPFCSRAVPTLTKIKDTYGKDVRVVFRHQPLPMHANAKIAAQASMAAHEQGKFWEMHDKLFANQRALDRASLEKYAQELKLDMAKFKAALDSDKFAAKLDADSAAGMAVGANGTPAFFINGRFLSGAQPFEAFKPLIDEEIAKADKALAAGTKAEDLYAKLNQDNVNAAPAAPAAPAEPAVQKVELGSAPVRGAKNAPVTIVAWSDFECPFCGRAVPTIEQVEKEYKGKVKFAFKHQPLPFHQHAKIAAQASMAANEQGKFWEMHDKLFANQRALDRASLEKYAQELKLDMAKFKAALDSDKFDKQIEADMADGAAKGANGTPTFFINGRTLVGAQPFDAFKKVIDEELKKAGGAVAAEAK
ncbi:MULTISPECIES: thioredoxin domain-containing protein [Corallococcus]|uniref:DsbA family protein n=1 Tax=Corallococcus TaxID=83461 RepID=UPI00117F1A1A|nr:MULTISPECIES: thioredoxin domain-containing protein [Corallococcus]NBD13509.1 thioredoxin domain-containing protein [Corallococcus silvisoli]TSC24524.1 thioredoxin [Corallococcus sp. Z5C101001]